MTESPASAGVLYLVATPIGNLEDITARAIRILKEVDLIAAEDTRVTRKLLAHFDIHTPLTSFHEHTAAAKSDALLAKLTGGASLALVSDAGTPCVSDPGAEFVASAAAAGIRVEPIPGACAAIAGLIASGLPTGRFVFEGFLPRAKSERQERLREVLRETRTIIFYEAANRLVETLEELRKTVGETRHVTVGREITKRFEEFRRGTLAEVAAHYRENSPRGECVILLEGAAERPPDEPEYDLDALIQAALNAGQSARDISRELATKTGMPKNEVYTRIQQLL